MRAAVALIVLFLAAPAPAGAVDYDWSVIRVIDGDTIAVEVPDLPPELRRIGVRLRGVDAPESGGRAKCDAERVRAERAVAFLEAALRSGGVIFRDPVWDKYGGRVVATVLVAGEDVGEAMVVQGLARHYDGGKRLPWCE